MVTREETPLPRALTIPYPDMFEADLDSNQDDNNDARAVVVEPEANPPERVTQVRQARVPPHPQRAPFSYASVAGGEFSGSKQVHSGDARNVVSDSSSNLPVSKPQSTQPLAPLQNEQSDPSTVRSEFSGRKQVASTSADHVIALFDAVYPAQRTSQTGRPTTPPPQRGPELSHPAVSKGRLGRGAKGALALGLALTLTGFLSFYSRGRGSQQLQAAPTPVTADVVTPVAVPQGSTMPATVLTPGTSRATARPALVQPFLTRTLGLKIGSIVIDPGHGGHDTGAVGPTGLMEKDLCLDVALRFGQIIKQRLPGAEVVFTRTDDTFIPLEKRTNIANEKKADLFLSIHANSNPYDAARGVETYYLNLKGSPEGLRVAARENATAQETVSDLRELVKKMARSEKIKESREFAEDIQNSLSLRIQPSATSARNGGVHRAPFAVLRGANMPSVLTEISFLSNPSDEQLLKKGEYRQRLAEGLYQGLASYLQSLNSITNNLPERTPAAGRSSSGDSSAESAAVEQSRNQQ
jgi:N-acetylmuramoyl-L-alanine amidase